MTPCSADRDHWVLATKYTISTDPADPNAGGNHRKSMIRSLDQSLRRLRTDYVTPAQAALARTRGRRRHAHPIVAARTPEQMADNLASVDLVLPGEVVDRLDAVSPIDLGFPTTMIEGTGRFVDREVGHRVDSR